MRSRITRDQASRCHRPSIGTIACRTKLVAHATLVCTDFLPLERVVGVEGVVGPHSGIAFALSASGSPGSVGS